MLELLVLNSILGDISKDEFSDQNKISYDLGNDILNFVGTSRDLLEQTISSFWDYRKSIFNTISKKSIENKMITLIYKLKTSNENVDNNIVTNFLKELENIPIEEWEIFFRLHGVNPIVESPLQLGPYYIYQWSQHSELIRIRYADRFAKYPEQESQWDFFWNRFEKDDATLISIRVQSRNGDRARELAEVKFKQFESTIRFMIGRHIGQFDVGIFDYRRTEMLDAVGLSPTHVFSNSQISGAIQPVPLNDPHFMRVDLGYDIIWELLKGENHPDLHKRILNAIEWAGKGAREPDVAKAFVQCMFGIESLLTFQEKGVLVTPSIASQISDFTAFILGNDVKSRKMHYSTMSRLYSSRSAIAHGGSNSVSLHDVQECLNILRKMISTLLSSPKFKDIKTIQGLKNWVEVQKFSTDSQTT